MPPDTGTVTIAIPTHNRTIYFKQALESCLNQTYPNVDILIGDTSTHDEIRDIAASYGDPRVRYHRLSPGLTLIEKLNDLMGKAGTGWMTFLCDDDVLDPDFLAALVPLIARHPDATQVRARYRLIDSDGRPGPVDPLVPATMGPFEFISRVFSRNRELFVMNISGVLFPVDLMGEMGGFRNFFMGLHSDRLAWAQLGTRGVCVNEPRPLCSIRIHGGSVSGGGGGDYERRVEATLQMRQEVDRLLSSMEAKIRSEQDRERLRLARSGAAAYIDRCLQSALDHGFIAALGTPESAGRPSIKKVFIKMRELGIPAFRSAYVYALVAGLPPPIRSPLIRLIRRRKSQSLQDILKG